MASNKHKHKHQKNNSRAQERPADQGTPSPQALPPVAAHDVHAAIDGQAGDADKQKDHKPRGKRIRIDRWLAAVITAATVAQAFFAYVQWNVMKTQVKIMELDQRAWLDIEGMRILDLTPGNKITVIFQARNRGKLAGSITRLGAHVFVHNTIPNYSTMAPPELKESFEKVFKMLRSPQGKLNPDVLQMPSEPLGDSTIPMIMISDDPVSEDVIQQIKSGKAAIYACGAIEYSDSIGQSRTTTFCDVYYADTDTFIPFPAYNTEE